MVQLCGAAMMQGTHSLLAVFVRVTPTAGELEMIYN